MMRMPSKRAFHKLLCISAAVLFCLHGMAAPALAVNFAATSPWIGTIAAFIVGDRGKVRNLSVWNASGGASRVGKARANEHIMALDRKDAANFGAAKAGKKLHLMYENMPVSDVEFIRSFFDPARLPFIAQNVMKMASEADPKNYKFYQRRLAEFQSRIESTSGVGAFLLNNIKILDITGAEGYWARSAVQGVVRPPDSVWNGWLKGDTVALKAALDEAAKRKWLLLLDVWTPPQIRAAAAAYPYRLTLPAPQNGQDIFVYLHNIFIAIKDKKPSAAK